VNLDFKNINPSHLAYAYSYLHRFMPMSQEELAGLIPYCEFREFNKKEIIVNAGEIDQYLNLVVKGLVRKYIKVKKNDKILQLATEGHVVHSEISFLTRTPSLVILQTMEPTVMISLRFDKMEEALEKYPHGERLGRMILSNMYIKKDERRYTWMAKSVRERFLDYVTQHPHMLQRVPQKYLASYLNIKPETFSRLKHLCKIKN
jgi:CRP-like cAMP-binding protein